jgi:hypothetical protein
MQSGYQESVKKWVYALAGQTQPEKIRLIVAGTRGDWYEEFFNKTMESLLADLYEKGYTKDQIIIISGMAMTGADRFGADFANKHGLELDPHPAYWEDLKAPGAVIKKNSRGKDYNARAGFNRNIEMAKVATHAIVFWDGKSSGSEHMLATAREFGLTTIEVRLDSRQDTRKKDLTEVPNDDIKINFTTETWVDESVVDFAGQLLTQMKNEGWVADAQL